MCDRQQYHLLRPFASKSCCRRHRVEPYGSLHLLHHVQRQLLLEGRAHDLGRPHVSERRYHGNRGAGEVQAHIGHASGNVSRFHKRGFAAAIREMGDSSPFLKYTGNTF